MMDAIERIAMDDLSLMPREIFRLTQADKPGV